MCTRTLYLAALELETEDVDEGGLLTGVAPEQCQEHVLVLVVTLTGFHQHVQDTVWIQVESTWNGDQCTCSDIENCEGWLSPSGHSSGGRALMAKVRGPRFNPGWLLVFHSSLKILPSLFSCTCTHADIHDTVSVHVDLPQ